VEWLDSLHTVVEEENAIEGRGTGKGSWVMRVGESGLDVKLRSLVWPGYEFSCTVGSPNEFGGAYFGTGEKNHDLLFML